MSLRVSEPDGPVSSPDPIVVAGPRPSRLADDVRTQHLWLALEKRRWRSLALVSASTGTPTLAAANSLANIAWWYTGVPSCVFDMRDLSLRLLEHQLRDMATQLNGGERIFIALRSTLENPTAVPLAQAADAAVLCVELGKTDMRGAQRTLDAVGRQIGIQFERPPGHHGFVLGALRQGEFESPFSEKTPGATRVGKNVDTHSSSHSVPIVTGPL